MLTPTSTPVRVSFFGMRTTLKRRIGRWDQATGNGRSTSAPVLRRSRISHYQQPSADWRVLRGIGRFVLNAVIVIAVLAGGIGGGLYLWAHQKISQTAAHSLDVKSAQNYLKAPLPDQPVIALLVGYDHRAGVGGDPGRSDTLMLVRADPREQTRSISLLSFPRDLRVPLYCSPDYPFATGKINAAYTRCGAKGSLLTVAALTGLPINYVISLRFRGFMQIVSRMGGVWVDIDRRYYVPQGAGYASIDLHPGYQHLNGQQALDFVRYRHGDSDLIRVIRQQQFMRALRDQAQKLGLVDYTSIINTLANNLEIGKAGGGTVSMGTLLGYARLAQLLPSGRMLQVKIENVYQNPGGSSDMLVSQSEIDKAVQQFANPDLTASTRAASQNHVAEAKASAPAAPAPEKTTVLVLNGSDTEGLAGDTSSGLALRGYKVVEPSGGVPANYPGAKLWHSVVYYDPAQAGAKAAASELATFFDPASVQPLVPKVAALANGAMVVAALGRTFDGTLPAIVPKVEVPKAEPPRVKTEPGLTVPGLRILQPKFRFRLEAPYQIESSSYLSTDSPRIYWITKNERTLRLTFKMAGSDSGYWGVQETSWADAPILAGTHFTHHLGQRLYDFYYQGAHLHMVVMHAAGASYWVVNTLDDQLSNETMIAIARSLHPVSGRLHK